MQFTGWRKPISISGLARPLALYCADGLVFCPAARLSKAIAVTLQFGHTLDFPEHPDKGYTQADDDAQKNQGQARGCEHGEHP
jgi:hypothetical protein